MSKREETEKRVPLITRTHITSYRYRLYKMDGGQLEALEDVSRETKFKQSELNKLAKENGVKQVIAELIGTEETLVGMTLEEFLKQAKPVVNGKLED